MDVQIRTHGTTVTDSMRDFVDRRMAKLDRLAAHVSDAVLELRTETLRSGAEETTAQITLRAGKHIIRAEAEATEPAKAIDMAIDRLISNVRKFTDKRTSRRRRASSPAHVPPTPPQSAGVTLPEDLDFDHLPADGSGESLVARTKSFEMDPMDVDMAIEQMELIGHDFFFFKNQADEKFSVLYRRRDGTYGILSPDS